MSGKQNGEPRLPAALANLYRSRTRLDRAIGSPDSRLRRPSPLARAFERLMVSTPCWTARTPSGLARNATARALPRLYKASRRGHAAADLSLSRWPAGHARIRHSVGHAAVRHVAGGTSGTQTDPARTSKRRLARDYRDGSRWGADPGSAIARAAASGGRREPHEIACWNVRDPLKTG